MQQATAVFSNAAARTAAITSPVEGQLTYLEDVDRYEHYNGTAWTSPFGLTHIATQPFSAVTSVSFPDNSFTSEFDTYEVLFVHESSSTNNSPIFRLRAGTDDSTSNYRNAVFEVFVGGSSSSTSLDSGLVLYPGGRGASLSKLTIANPNKSLRTFIQSTSAPFASSSETNMRFIFGQFATSAVFDSCSFVVTSGTFTGYAILYGYRK
jgi:hypothetical protein